MLSLFVRKPSSISSHAAFVVLAFCLYLFMLAGLRSLLVWYNHDLLDEAARAVLFEAFANGLRFDARMTVFALIPLLLAFSSSYLMSFRRFYTVWLSFIAMITLLLGIIELNFYQEFHQRLNSLFFQYLKEDPATVLSMLWHGFPVVKLLLAWSVFGSIFVALLLLIERKTYWQGKTAAAWYYYPAAFVGVLLVAVVLARGTLRQGAPLRWGDAYTTSSMFVNHLGLNPVLSLADAAKATFSDHRNNRWRATMDDEEAKAIVRELLLLPHERLVDESDAAIRRVVEVKEPRLAVKNVVVILMESFAGRYVGALGGEGDITPYFDNLSKEGLLFTQFFSSGTHTHQGMFASMACFPNLPAFEYLMQTPEGSHAFSGLPQLLKRRNFQNVYVYNGDFAWDNQRGFFGGQGITEFVGRYDYVNPVFSDLTWGVSDQDMFARAVEEISAMAEKPQQPFYAFLQTLSNHTPYALPPELPVQAVTDFGVRNEHLTAMRYADWALGQFFESAKQHDWYQETLFVVIGDHGFGALEQLTEMDLYRFHIPMLLIAPGIQENYGQTRDTTASQVDMVPTIMGLLGGEVQHQCWGRDLLSLPEGDKGFAIIKPSGGDQTVAMIKSEHILVKLKDRDPTLWQFDLKKRSAIQLEQVEVAKREQWRKQLYAYIQTATKSLLDDTAGDRLGK